MRKDRRIWFVLGLIILFGGLNLTILLSHLSRAIGVLMIIAGLAVVLWATEEKTPAAALPSAARPLEAAPPSVATPPAARKRAPRPKKKTLASNLINLLTLDGILKPYLPIFGILIIAVLIMFNALVSRSTYLGSNDFVVMLLAGVLLLYNYVPRKYRVERDFALLFSVFLFAILVLPTTIYALAAGGDVDTNSRLTYYLLSVPTVMLVNLFGIPAVTPGYNPGLGDFAYNYIEVPGPDGNIIPVSIGISCAGLYSVAIFISAFIAFVAVEYNRFDRKVVKLLALGIFLAWVANIIRMAIIIAVGRYHGWSAMEWTHNNIGEIIFMLWIAIFWLILFKYLGVLDDLGGDKSIPGGAKSAAGSKESKNEEGKDERRGRKGEEKAKGRGDCEICQSPLSLSIPAHRCKCGRIYHRECIADAKNCPACHRAFPKK